MSDTDISKMDFKQLRNEVQRLSDELAKMRRKYEDVIYNLDDENFSSRLVKEKNGMATAIEITEKGLKTKVSAEELATSLLNYSTIEQTADAIRTEVAVLEDGIRENYSMIEQTATKISAIISGEYTDDMLDGYFTGIEIAPNQIKMIDGSVCSVYSSSGLKFYDSTGQVEGWSIEPDAVYGGVLNYYVNDGNCYRFGCGASGSGYASTDMVIKALNTQRGRFVVDVEDSGNPEVRFVGVNENGNSKAIYVNGQLLATQDWVQENSATGGTALAVFG